MTVAEPPYSNDVKLTTPFATLNDGQDTTETKLTQNIVT
jgi:hypothetical protein